MTTDIRINEVRRCKSTCRLRIDIVVGTAHSAIDFNSSWGHVIFKTIFMVIVKKLLCGIKQIAQWLINCRICLGRGLHFQSHWRIFQQHATVFSLLHICRQLYMVRMLTPFIKSSYYCNCYHQQLRIYYNKNCRLTITTWIASLTFYKPNNKTTTEPTTTHMNNNSTQERLI